MTKTEQRINVILDQLNEQLALHDGSCKLTGIVDGVARIKFYGACANCMSQSDTFDDVIKATLLEEVPNLKDVIVDESMPEDMLEMARKILRGEMK